jgi:serine/threonine-protein kinase
VIGTPVPVLEQVLQTPVGAVDAVVSSNGTLVYVASGLGGAARSLVWVDRTGREEPLAAPVRSYEYPRISPDGARIAVNVRDDDQDIWTWDLARQTLTRLTFHPAADAYPVWSPDSQYLIFASQRAGAFNLYRQAADGTGAVERLTESVNPQFPYTVTREGTEVIFRESRPGHDLMILPMRSPGSSRPLVSTMYFERNADLSPDGRWLAYDSNESGREEIYVRPFPDVDKGRWQVSGAGGRIPLWSGDGRELFYVSPEGALMGVRVEPGALWRNSTPAPIVRGEYFYASSGLGRTYDIAADGQRFLMIKEAGNAEASAVPRIVVVQNWTEEVKRLVPVN